jgi:hypothetical protein
MSPNGAVDGGCGSKIALMALKSDFRFSPKTGLRSDICGCLKCAKLASRGLFDRLTYVKFTDSDAALFA